MGVPPDVEPIALSGFQPVHRVAQSYLGSLWIALDKRRGEPGNPVLLRRLQLPDNTPEDARQCIVRAAHDAIALRAEGVLAVLEVIEQGDSIAAVYEHVEAEPLRSLQSWANLRALSFPAGVSLKMVSDLLVGVEALHGAHSTLTGGGFGGLSPDSVLVARDGRTLLADPLVASCACLLEELGHHTAKLAYAAPEQVHAVAPLTPAADNFACGVLLWELLTGRRLLSGSRAAMERKLLEHNLPSLAGNLRGDQHVSNLLIEVVGRALAADPESRPASARALANEFAAAGHEVASREQVAQFIGKLSGQRLDRRSAAVRSKSTPDLSAAADWSDAPKSATSGQRAAGPASSSGSFPARSVTALGTGGPAAAAARLFSEPSPAPSTELRSSARPAVLPNSPATTPSFAAVPPSAGLLAGASGAPPASKPAPSSRAPALGTSLGLGSRTVAGLGMPNHPALAATAPFANITPPPIHPPSAPSAAATLGSGAAPAAPTSAIPAVPTPTRATPPSVVTSAPPTPISVAPPPKQQVATRPSASPALASTVFLAPATQPSVHPPPPEAPPERLVPLVAPRGRSTRSLSPGNKVPPSSQRKREGWARRLVPAGLPPWRSLLGTLLACVALAGALAVVLVLRRPKPQSKSGEPAALSAAAVEPATAPSIPAAPGAAQAAPEPDRPGNTAAPTAPSPRAETAAPTPAGTGEFDTKELDDVQLARLFALERRSNVPACKEPARKTNTKVSPASVRSASLELKAARHELTRGKPDRARPLLCSAIAQDPNNAAAFAALAGLALELGDPARAEEVAARGLEHKPRDGALLGVEGDALVLLSDIPGGRKLWLQTQSGSSDEDRAKRLASTSRVLADRALRSANYAGALTLYRRALVLTQGGYQPSLGLAAALHKLGQSRAALAWSERSAHAFPKDSQVQIAFGDALYQNGRKDAARLAWQAARDAQPTNKLAARRLSKGKP